MKKIFFLLIVSSLLIATAILRAEAVWSCDFNPIENWYDNTTDPSFHAVIVPGAQKGTADIIQKGEGNWGKVAFAFKDINIDKYNIIKVNVADVQKDTSFKILAVSQDWSESFVVIDRGHGKGIAQGNIKDVTGWSGVKTFNLVVVIEGEKKKITLNSLELGTKDSLSGPSSGKTDSDSTKKVAGANPETIWSTDFSTIENWYDNNTDPTFHAVIVPGAQKGTADVIQKGEGTWGKVAFVFKDVNIDKFNVLKLNVADVQKGAGFQVLAAAQDWSETFVVIDRGHGKGMAQGNIKDVTGWSGVKTFNLVINIEGEKKKVTLSSIELSSGADTPKKNTGKK
jgi:hypothetical protein